MWTSLFRISSWLVFASLVASSSTCFAADDAAWGEFFQQAESRRPQAIEQKLEQIKTLQTQLKTAKGDDRQRHALELKNLRKELAGLKSGALLPPVVVGVNFKQGSIGVLNNPDIEVEIVKVIDGERALGKVYGNDFIYSGDTNGLSDGQRMNLSHVVVEVSGKASFAPVLGAGTMVPVVKVVPSAELQRRHRDFLRQRK